MSILANFPSKLSVPGSVSIGEVSDVAPTTCTDFFRSAFAFAAATAINVFTVVTSVGGPGITLAESGTATVFNGATYIIDADLPAPTSNATATDTNAPISTSDQFSFIGDVFIIQLYEPDCFRDSLLHLGSVGCIECLIRSKILLVELHRYCTQTSLIFDTTRPRFIHRGYGDRIWCLVSMRD
ncbi:hypothetical protein B0H17DRAFT_1326898 [Mycena rosella]|uniref:Uncharacterized protein n=1 Tax=Mycena rosella TaxID=1033263 RepID=A0AAD7GN99_MYCRO|nr:hypothetical protein B0H17DRAFT_1326898 [Mycena rosella]